MRDSIHLNIKAPFDYQRYVPCLLFHLYAVTDTSVNLLLRHISVVLSIMSQL
jgi:hypothetical protein